MAKSKISLRGISRGTTLAVRSLRSDMRRIFTEPSEQEAEETTAERLMKHPVYRHGKIVLMLGLLAWMDC
ncbi:MAG: hypothetical protein JW837_08635 [Sedimentisphaerales bacterium]|nr:hypothetical protein [Sedimentisphaerales bacterium]